MPAYCAKTVEEFLITPTAELVAVLTRAYEQDRYKDLMIAQFAAWRDEIELLKSTLNRVAASFETSKWGICLEFVIPRRMGRLDAILLIGDAIVGLEFKTQLISLSAAMDQIEDYCLDLIHFHETSRNRLVYPAVVGIASETSRKRRAVRKGLLMQTKSFGPNEFVSFVSEIAARHESNTQIAIADWNAGQYHPVPSIIEAAICMFAEMEVEDIAKADCDEINLTETVSTVLSIAKQAKKNGWKTACFITGVPGAGKTLAGLKLVHEPSLRGQLETDAVFLTGNLPLVKVLRKALTKDVSRRKKQKLKISGRDPKTTIDTVLGYKKTHTKTGNPPHEKVVVFDEAQRAWDAKRTAEYLEDEDWKGYSEPGLLMTILDRHDWAVLIALVGGGQEINRGEAGIGEWGDALLKSFTHWHVAASQQALEGVYGAGAKLFVEGMGMREVAVDVYPTLHLDNPTRQFRGKTIAAWVEALLEGDSKECSRILGDNPEYPIYLTRDLPSAKRWMEMIASGTERYGCIASSEAKRLRAEGLELPPARADGVEEWFLAPKGDIRSSFQLEVAASEFQIQGLELDWACVCWGSDFVRKDSTWELKRLRGTRWQNVGQNAARKYLINTYRVLLTRARQGMVLFVPLGSDSDLTRPTVPLDSTAAYLIQCGAKQLTHHG